MIITMFNMGYFEKLFLLNIVFSTFLYTGHGQDFGYDGNNGPNHWGEKFQHCVGKHQSPINIEEHNVRIVQLPKMNFINFEYKPKEFILKNTGHTVVTTMETNPRPTLTGGPLISGYEFEQFHFHWGANDEEGSENTINNSSFPLELHLVFYDKDYGSFKEALEHPDGLTVLAVLFSNSEENNTNYQELLHSLESIQNPFTNTTLDNPPSLSQLMPEDPSVYFTYGGSLTTPPCSEVVTWIEFKSTVPLAHEQIELFRHLKSEHGHMVHNFRPVQPLHGRIIRMHRDAVSNEIPTGIKSQLQVANETNHKNTGFQNKPKYISLIITTLLSFILIKFFR